MWQVKTEKFSIQYSKQFFVCSSFLSTIVLIGSLIIPKLYNERYLNFKFFSHSITERLVANNFIFQIEYVCSDNKF
jgi:hypothetical protein